MILGWNILFLVEVRLLMKELQFWAMLLISLGSSKTLKKLYLIDDYGFEMNIKH